VARGRDIEAFAERAGGYERGWLGKLHRDIAHRVADIALTRSPTPHRILDVGCGTGYLLRQLASRVPETLELAGIDAAAPMIEVARAKARDARLRFLIGVAEQLPQLRRDLRPRREYNVVRPLARPTSRTHRVRKGDGTWRSSGGGRPIFSVARAHAAWKPKRQSSHQSACRTADIRGWTARGGVA